MAQNDEFRIGLDAPHIEGQLSIDDELGVRREMNRPSRAKPEPVSLAVRIKQVVAQRLREREG